MSSISTPAGLPPQRTGFVGRESEVQAAIRFLTDPGGGPVTITGSGGIGKTRIAIEVARRTLQGFPDGIGFVPLAPIDSPEDIIQAILTTLGLELHSTSESLVEGLRRHLADRAVLLLLDSFEHLVKGADLVDTLVSASPATRILITSQQPLGLQHERVVDVEGLDCSSSGDEGTAALELFRACARRVRPGFELTWDMEPLAVDICRRLEGNPLAIELAASWLEDLSLAQICLELEAHLISLGTDSTGVLERHRSLTRVMEYSWSLLPDVGQKTLEELSVFRGGFTADAAENICRADSETLDMLAARSLIRRETGGRFSLHEAARQYGTLRLKQEQSRNSLVHANHSSYYADLMLSMESGLKSGDKKKHIDRLGPDLENIRSAWKWAVKTSRAHIIADCLQTFYTLYTTRGWYREGSRLFSDALEQLGSGRRQDIRTATTIGRLSLKLGWLEVCLGRYPEATELISDSLVIFSEIKDPAHESSALYYLSSLSLFKGDFPSAEELARKSLRKATDAMDLHRIGLAWGARGNVARRKGSFEKAESFYTESLSVFERMGDEVGRSVALGNLGIVAYRQNKLERALNLSSQSLAIVEEIGDQRLIAETYCDLGNVYRQLNRIEEAGNCYARSLRLNRELGIRSATAIALVNVAHYENLRGNFRKAERSLEEAYDIAMSLGRRPIAIQTLNVRGWMATARGDLLRAREHFLSGLRLIEGQRAIPVILNLFSGLAYILASNGLRERAMNLIGFILACSGSPIDPPGRSQEAIRALDPPPSEKEIKLAMERMEEIRLSEIAEQILEEAG